MWDRNGFESILDVTRFRPDSDESKQLLLDTLKTGEPKYHNRGPNITAMQMRARINSDRDYEIYLFTSVDSVDHDDLANWARSSPQSLVDWIRKNHTKCFWSRGNSNTPTIQ